MPKLTKLQRARKIKLARIMTEIFNDETQKKPAQIMKIFKDVAENYDDSDTDED